MRRSGWLACTVAAALLLASAQAHAGGNGHAAGSFKFPTWAKVLAIGTFVCASGIIGAALSKNAQQNKPLTATEATSCGWRWWVR